MNSDIKPDFEAIAEKRFPDSIAIVNDNDMMDMLRSAMIEGMNEIYPIYLGALSAVKRLQEENEQLKEALKNAANKARLVTQYKNEPPIYSETARLSSGAQVKVDKDSILKQLES